MSEIGKFKFANAIPPTDANEVKGKKKGDKPKPAVEAVEGSRGQKRQVQAGRRGSR